MISNSNRSGAVGTQPEGRDHQSGKDMRSGKVSTAPSRREEVTVIKVEPKPRVIVKDGRLEVVTSK
jgi:hypothetical protein